MRGLNGSSCKQNKGLFSINYIENKNIHMKITMDIRVKSVNVDISHEI